MPGCGEAALRSVGGGAGRGGATLGGATLGGGAFDTPRHGKAQHTGRYAEMREHAPWVPRAGAPHRHTAHASGVRDEPFSLVLRPSPDVPPRYDYMVLLREEKHAFTRLTAMQKYTTV